MSRRGNGEGSIYDRVQRRVRKDGTVVEKTIWCASVSLDYGERKVIYGNTREEVAAELVRILGARQGGLAVPGVRLKVGPYLEQWLEDTVKPSRKPLTYVRYENVTRRHLIPTLGKVPLSKLGPREVQRLQAHIISQGLGQATVLGARNILSAALTQAERWGLIARNPVPLVPAPRSEPAEPRCLSPEEATAFLAAARGDVYEYLFATMLATGLRPGEARGLGWATVHLDRAVLEVRQQSIDMNRSLASPKSRHGRRHVPLVPLALWALEQQKARPVRALSGLVFAADDGRPPAARTIRSHFDSICARAGIEGATPHTLRHSTGTYLLAAGVPDRVVQEILGHGSAAMTRHYQHVTDSMLGDAGARLGAFLGASGVATHVATPSAQSEAI